MTLRIQVVLLDLRQVVKAEDADAKRSHEAHELRLGHAGDLGAIAKGHVVAHQRPIAVIRLARLCASCTLMPLS